MGTSEEGPRRLEPWQETLQGGEAFPAARVRETHVTPAEAEGLTATFAAGLELALVLLQASSCWRPSAEDRGRSLNQPTVLLLTSVQVTIGGLDSGHARPSRHCNTELHQLQRVQKGSECKLAWLPFHGATLAPDDGHLPLQVPGHHLPRMDTQALGLSCGRVTPAMSLSTPAWTSSLHPHLCSHSPGEQVALASALFSQFSRLECLAGPGGQRATPEAEAEQTVGRGKGLGSGSQRKDPVWNPDPVSQSQSWEAQEALADSGFSLLQAAEVSVSKLLVIPFFN